jgi:hypothetical protein
MDTDKIYIGTGIGIRKCIQNYYVCTVHIIEIHRRRIGELILPEELSLYNCDVCCVQRTYTALCSPQSVKTGDPDCDMFYGMTHSESASADEQ